MNNVDFQTFLIESSQIIKRSGVPNYKGCHIPIPSKINFKFLQEKLSKYHDKIVVDLLKFGFPLDFNATTGVKTVPRNHAGARDFKPIIKKQIEKEIRLNACIGPFRESPFGNDIRLSPLNSVPKKDSLERWLILDLSFPHSNAVNDSISKDSYQGKFEKLVLPLVDNLVERIVKLGKGCKIWKVDLSRAYRQVFLDPKDIRYVGFMVDGEYFFDCTLSMGSHSSARCCQRVTSAIHLQLCLYLQKKGTSP